MKKLIYILIWFPAAVFSQAFTSSGMAPAIGANGGFPFFRVGTPPTGNTYNIVSDTLYSFPIAKGPGRFAAANVDNTWSVEYVTAKDSGPGSLDDVTQTMGDKTFVLLAVGGHFNPTSRLFQDGDSNIRFEFQTANDIGGFHWLASNMTGNKDIYLDNYTDLVVRFADVRGMWWEFINLGNAGRFPAITVNRSYNAIFDHITTMWSSYALNFSKIPFDDYINYNGGRYTIQHAFFGENVRGHNTGHVTGVLMDYVRDRFANTTAAQEGAWASWEDQLHYRVLSLGISHRVPFNTGSNALNAHATAVNYWAWGPRDRLQRNNTGGTNINHKYNVFELSKFSGESTWADAATAGDLHKFNESDFYNLGFSGFAGTPIPYVLQLHAEGNWFLNEDGTQYTGFSDYRDSWQQFDTSVPTSYANINFRPTWSPDYPLPIETNLTALEQILLDNTGASIRFNNDGTTTREDDTELFYIDWWQNNTEPTFVSSTNGDGGSTDSNRMDSVPTDWETRAGSRNLATYDSDLDGMPDTFETAHGVTDPWGVKTNWTFQYGDDTVNWTNNAGYVNLVVCLSEMAGDFRPWYIIRGYY